jgi:ankyrin repeat protein
MTGNTALHEACLHLRLEDAKAALLIPDDRAGKKNSAINAVNTHGTTPLHCVFRSMHVARSLFPCHLPMVKLLLENNADVNAVWGASLAERYGTVLDYCLQFLERLHTQGIDELLDLLISHGGRFYRSGTPWEQSCGLSYLTSASSFGDMVRLSQLLQNHHQPPLGKHSEPFESILLDRDSTGVTALHKAKNIEVAKFLLERREQVRTNEGRATAQHSSTFCSWVSRRMLLATNKSGRLTPLNWAKQFVESAAPSALQSKQEKKTVIAYLESYLEYPVAVSTSWQRPNSVHDDGAKPDEGPTVIVNSVYNEFQRNVAEETYALLDRLEIREASYVILGFLTLVDVMARAMP